MDLGVSRVMGRGDGGGDLEVSEVTGGLGGIWGSLG